MARTTVEMLSRWFDEGVNLGATHMVIVTDTWNNDSYPVYVTPSQDASVIVHEQHSREWQRIEEVYNLQANKTFQMKPHVRVWNL